MNRPSATTRLALIAMFAALSGCSKCGEGKAPVAADKTAEPSVDIGKPAQAPVVPPASPQPTGAPLLDLGAVVSADDLPSAMKKGPPVSSEKIQGLGQSAGYDSKRFFVPGTGDLGVGVQWWHYGTNSEAVIRYMKDLHSFAQATASEEVATHSFRSIGYRSIVLAFFDDPKRSVVIVTCGAGACGFSADAGATPDAWATLLELAKKIDGRLPELDRVNQWWSWPRSSASVIPYLS